jgi:hypothetical protein
MARVSEDASGQPVAARALSLCDLAASPERNGKPAGAV